MHSARIILLRRFLPVGALHPRRRTGRRHIGGVIDVSGRWRFGGILIAHSARLHLRIGPAHSAERIGLTDQPRKFGQGIALAPGGAMLVVAAIVIVIRGKRSVLISISHRDDASPSGKPSIRLYE